MKRLKIKNKERRLWRLAEVLNYLQIGRTTIFSLIKRGELPAVKIGKSLRFRRRDLERFVTQHLTISGLVATKPYIFEEAVLGKYQSASDIYYCHDETFAGRLGLRDAWVGKFPSNFTKLKPEYQSTKSSFVDVFYNKIELKDKRVVILLSADEMAKIPPNELVHWYRFRIQNPGILPWM